jgi:hypothetical protein
MTTKPTVTRTPQGASSPPPKSGPAAYPRRPGTQRERDRPAVRIELPDQPPGLTPAAARALLRILLKAHAHFMEHHERKEN